MTASSILERAKALGIEVEVAGSRIRYSPKSKAPPDFVAELRQYKPAVVRILERTTQCRNSITPHYSHDIHGSATLIPASVIGVISILDYAKAFRVGGFGPVRSVDSMVRLRTPKPGRPRLDNRKGFGEDFCRILPRVLGGELTPREAAGHLGISVRSFERYAERWRQA